ncbi:MAG: RimK/LysX family protein, partial [Gammaproteobacteria bacterium]
PIMLAARRQHKHRLLSLIFATFLLPLLSPVSYAAEVLGWVENVRLSPGNIIISAKIDTGADTSSLHCDCQPPYERDGKQRIRFSTTDLHGKRTDFDKAIVRTAKIKRHAGDSQTRVVVRMGICIGTQFAETDVSLVNRSGFNYSMLIGRNVLAGRFIVDPSRQHVTKPDCAINIQ